MDMPVNVPVDDPNADTEWNDILRKHKIIPEKATDPDPIIEQALLEAYQRAHDNRLEDKDVDELHDLEDDEDDAFLEKYRQQRLAEISALQKSSLHGQVYPLQKPDYAKDVTEASSKCYVLVHLTSSLGTNVETRVLSERWREIARKFGEVKFCEIRAELCIEGYPEKNTPTILVYKDGDIKRQIVTLRELNGPKTSVRDLEMVLVQAGAIRENDMRSRGRDEEDEAAPNRGIRGNTNGEKDSDEDDWD